MGRLEWAGLGFGGLIRGMGAPESPSQHFKGSLKTTAAWGSHGEDVCEHQMVAPGGCVCRLTI